MPRTKQTRRSFNSSERRPNHHTTNRRRSKTSRVRQMQRHRKQGRSWSTDVETATCLKTQLRLNYHEAITITEPDEYQRFRIKIMGCRHQNIAEPTLIDIQRAEHDFRISNNITPGVHFRIEKNV